MSGPCFEINTRPQADKYLTIGIDVTLFNNVTEGLLLEVKQDGIAFELDLDVADAGNLRLDCLLGVDPEAESVTDGVRFRADGQLTLALNGDIGPIKADVDVPVIGEVEVDLGKIHLDVDLDGSMDIELNPLEEVFRIDLDSSFEFDGAKLTIPTLQFNADDVIQSLDELPERILHHIEDEAQTIFHDLLREASRALSDVGREIGQVTRTAEHEIEKAETWAAQEIGKTEATAQIALEAIETQTQHEVAKIADEAEHYAARLLGEGKRLPQDLERGGPGRRPPGGRGP